jgi:hypothetical protein
MNRAGLGSLSALIAGSFCITYLVNLVGYLDIVMILMVLTVLAVPNPRLQLVTAAVFGIAGVLLHELYVIAFLPVSLATLVCWAGQKKKPALAAGIVVALLIPAILFSLLTHRPELTEPQAIALGQEIQSRVNFRAFTPMMGILSSPASIGRSYMLHMMSIKTWWVMELFGLLAFLPTTIFFLTLAWRWAAPFGRVAQGYLLAAAFAPMLLNFAGYDRYRWLMMMGLDAILSSIAVAWSRSRSGDKLEELNVRWRRAAVLLLAVNLATDIGFFVGAAQGFPFKDYWWLHHIESRHSDLSHLQPSDGWALDWSQTVQNVVGGNNTGSALQHSGK